ncbi:hypothetical protein CASFOL_013652 [Castilleja foliolosa]|uniref:RNase H type-1 domain-containing protein n=1 Tax=Castilleja foliolosa TaxID=1961234 RepID=A0ABD3DL97_9LAMI
MKIIDTTAEDPSSFIGNSIKAKKIVLQLTNKIAKWNHNIISNETLKRKTYEFFDDAFVDEHRNSYAEYSDEGKVAAGPPEVELQILSARCPILDPTVFVCLHSTTHPFLYLLIDYFFPPALVSSSIKSFHSFTWISFTRRRDLNSFSTVLFDEQSFRASKTVLVKAVALAVPSYAMSVHLFPKGTCDKMDAHIRKFWWGTNANGNSFMPKCWDSICAPKSKGGLGFRRLNDMNRALIAKLAWYVLTNKDVLWVKLLNAKYLRGKNFPTDDIHSNNSSWLWKDISSCRDIIKKGAICTVNANSLVSIWKDPWIPSYPGFTPSLDNCPNAASLVFLKDLFDTNNLVWKLNVLSDTFTPDVVNEIVKIQISPENRPKTFLWSPSKSGNFSTKSVYLLSQCCRFTQPNQSNPFNWNNLWNSLLHNRHKLLVWKIVNNSLPCKAKLGSLFNLSNHDCVMCNSGVESLEHLFLICPYIQQVFFVSFWHFNLAKFAHLSIKDWLNLIFDKSNKLFNSLSERTEFQIFVVILFDWVWFNRNKIMHGGNALTVTKLTNLVSIKAKAHWLSVLHTLQAKPSSKLCWSPPASNWIKINMDSTFSNGDVYAGIVFRDDNGSLLLAASYQHNCIDSLAAECLAIWDACKLAENANCAKVIFESDCLTVISLINGTSNNNFWSADPVIFQIKRCWNGWPNWVFKFTPRRCNGAAHNLASWAAGCGFCGIIPLNNLPNSVFCDIGFPIVNSV